jgi:hypothetical protein
MKRKNSLDGLNEAKFLLMYGMTWLCWGGIAY